MERTGSYESRPENGYERVVKIIKRCPDELKLLIKLYNRGLSHIKLTLKINDNYDYFNLKLRGLPKYKPIH